jgi:hypothetical protein
MVTSTQQVLVVVDCERFTTAVLETAIFFAQNMQAELQCVFVEDQCLQQIADLPFSREILRHNASERQLTSHSLSRALAGYSQQIKQQLEHLASRHELQYSFKHLKIDSFCTLLSDAASADVLLFGEKVFGLQRRTPVQLTAAGDLCVFVSGKGKSSDEKLITTAMILARREHRNLNIYYPESMVLTDQPWEKALAAYLGPVQTRRFKSLLCAMQSMLRSNEWQTLVLPLKELLTEKRLLNQLLAHAGRRLVVVR